SLYFFFFFFSSRRRHTRSYGDWSSDVCSSDLDNRQTCLFSATMPPEIMRLTQEYMHDVKEIRLNEDEISLDTIAQSYLIVHEKRSEERRVGKECRSKWWKKY